MRVLIVNTSERTGGAAVAAGRLVQALTNNGVNARMLVRDKQTDALSVVGLPRSFRQTWHFLWERFVIFCHLRFSRNHLFEVDIANSGTDITSLHEFREADVVHLHWVNQGMLSLGDIRRILRSDKPVVWTMHDAWPATAICHYTRGCKSFKTSCRRCPLLPHGGSDHDLAAKVWRRKEQMLREANVSFVACSQWLEDEAKKSALLKGQHITSIPNTIDTRKYHPQDKQAARRSSGLPEDKRVVLFVSQRVTDSRKGMDYFVEAINQLADEHPDWRDNTVVAILGGHAEEVTDRLRMKACPLGYVNSDAKIVEIYNSADVFVLPSMEDNLPNTIMEAMACGVPCVGFNVGGIPEMIDHQKNGYVAEAANAADLAHGIGWVLGQADEGELSRNAVKKVARSYSQQSVAMRYIEVYNQAMAYKHYKI